MMTKLTVWLAAALISGAAVLAHSADMPSLQWGGFVVESDTSGKAKSMGVAIAPDSMSVSLVFDAIHADASAGTAEVTAAIAGHFGVSQPDGMVIAKMRVDLRGFVHTDKNGSGHLTVQVGPTTKSIDWPVGMERNEDFTESIEVAIPSGRLPSPFVVSASATAKAGAESNTVVTLDSIDFSVGK